MNDTALTNTTSIASSKNWDLLSWQTRFVRQIAFSDVDKCWEWQGTTNTGGYGTILVFAKPNASHRLMWKICYGKIPEGMFICHKCDNRRCVNPSHLFIGTNKDNMRDMVSKGRRPRTIGIDNPNCKLTIKDVMRIRDLAKNGTDNYKIARKFNIWPGHIWRIVNRRAWTHLLEEVTNGK